MGSSGGRSGCDQIPMMPVALGKQTILRQSPKSMTQIMPQLSCQDILSKRQRFAGKKLKNIMKNKHNISRTFGRRGPRLNRYLILGSVFLFAMPPLPTTTRGNHRKQSLNFLFLVSCQEGYNECAWVGAEMEDLGGQKARG